MNSGILAWQVKGMHELAKIMAKVKGGQYDGAMIIKAVWELEAGAGSQEPVILKENRKLLVCKAHWQGESLTVTMLLGHQVPADSQVMVEADMLYDMLHDVADKAAWEAFPRQRVVDFVQAVGDSNPIHQTENPIVPGMLLMENIIDSLPEGVQEVSLSFRKAVFANDVLHLQLRAAGAEPVAAESVAAESVAAESVVAESVAVVEEYVQPGARAHLPQGSLCLLGRDEYIKGNYR